MGCSQSKLEPGDQAAVRVAAVAAGKRQPSSGRKRFGDIRRRRNAGRESRRGRFSTNNLIRPYQESDAGDESYRLENRAAAGDKPAIMLLQQSPPPEEVTKEDKEESNKRKKKGEKKDKKMEKVAVVGEKKAKKLSAMVEEELPGSPSFRFYFDGSTPRWMENEEAESAVATKNYKDDQGKGKQKVNIKITSEDNAARPNAKLQESWHDENDQGNRFKALARGSNKSFNVNVGL